MLFEDELSDLFNDAFPSVRVAIRPRASIKDLYRKEGEDSAVARAKEGSVNTDAELEDLIIATSAAVEEEPPLMSIPVPGMSKSNATPQSLSLPPTFFLGDKGSNFESMETASFSVSISFLAAKSKAFNSSILSSSLILARFTILFALSPNLKVDNVSALFSNSGEQQIIKLQREK